MSESSVGRSRWFKFSIGARASSPRGLRDGVSLCFSLKLVLCRGVIGIREEKKRSGQAGLLVPKAATPSFSLPLSPPVKRENVWRA